MVILLRLCVLGLLWFAVACGGDQEQSGLRIYDPTGDFPQELTTDDVVRQSARAARTDPTGGWTVHFSLTDAGERKFRALTRSLAERGAEEDTPQTFVVALDGRTYATVEVDYRAFPRGLDGRQGIQIDGVDAETAEEIVNSVRRVR